MVTRLRFPDGLMTANAGSRSARAVGWRARRVARRMAALSAPSMSRPAAARGASGTTASLSSFARSTWQWEQYPPTSVRARTILKAEVTLDLFAHLLQQVAEELLDFAAAQANHVGMFLFQARFVIVLVAVMMHQVQLVHQAAGLQQLECAVDGDAVELRIFFAGELVEALGVQVLAGLIDQIEQDLAAAASAARPVVSANL